VADAAQFAQRVRFGGFEVDLRTQELWKSGRKRKLTGQPFAVLAILLEHPGEVVSREELQQRLWPDTFVDVDHNLNAAINKIREALGDSSEHPRFVETLSRRGYRFIAPVAVVESPGNTPVQPSVVEPQPQPPEASVAMISAAPASVPGIAKPRKRSKWWWWPVAAAVILIIAYFLRPALPPPQVTGVTQLTQDGASKLFGDGYAQLLTDGSRIYFAEYLSEGGSRLMQVSTDGGEAQPVEMPFRFDGLHDISPSRSELLIGGPPLTPTDVGDGQWLLPLPGGQARRVGSLLVFDATFTPDGNAIYYSTGPYIYRANTDGSQRRKVLTAKGVSFGLRFSPDGRLLRFSTFNPSKSNTSLWEAHADGSHLRQLFAHWKNTTNICCGNWTSDGKYYIFQATQNGVSELWTQRVQGEWWRKVSHAPVRLTLGQMNSAGPLPNRDGTKVFFIGVVRKDEIIRYEPSTHSFLLYLPGLSATDLAFTADGKKVAYVTYPEGLLWESNADGSDRRELSFPPIEAALPRWSPDGTEIAFTAHGPGKLWQVFVVPAEGGDPRQLTSGTFNATDPSWSSDGNSLAFGENPDYARDTKGNAIHILNLKTHQVTDVSGSAGLFSPRWSPDGRYLLTMTYDGQKLMLYDFATHQWEVLAKVGAAYPNWSKDGKCVYFNGRNSKNLPIIYRVCLAGRKLEHIMDLSQAGALAVGDAGRWTGLGPDGSILAARDIGTDDIYALNTKFPR